MYIIGQVFFCTSIHYYQDKIILIGFTQMIHIYFFHDLENRPFEQIDELPSRIIMDILHAMITVNIWRSAIAVFHSSGIIDNQSATMVEAKFGKFRWYNF